MNASDLRDDPRLTAYALGELDSAQRIEVERLLSADLAACAEMQAIAAFSTALGAELGNEAGAIAGLSAAQRAAIAQAAQTRPAVPAKPASLVAPAPARSWTLLIPIGGAALAAGILVAIVVGLAGRAAPLPDVALVEREADRKPVPEDRPRSADQAHAGPAATTPVSASPLPTAPVAARAVPPPDASVPALAEAHRERADTDGEATPQTLGIRVAFDRIVENPGDPAAVGVVVEINKLITDVAGGKGKWLARPVAWKLLKPGDPLDFMKDVPDPLRGDIEKRTEHFETPFVLGEVQKDVRRVLYYEIVAKRRPGGDRQFDLEVKPKEVSTETATLEDKQTGRKLVLIKLARIAVPVRPGLVTYPNFGTPVYDEAEEFRKDPAGLRQWGLIPQAPIDHDPGTGPLEDMRKKTGDASLETDTKYYELADGRLVFWRSADHRLITFCIPGSQSDLRPVKTVISSPGTPADPASGEAKTVDPTTVWPPAGPPAR